MHFFVPLAKNQNIYVGEKYSAKQKLLFRSELFRFIQDFLSKFTCTILDKMLIVTIITRSHMLLSVADDIDLIEINHKSVEKFRAYFLRIPFP